MNKRTFVAPDVTPGCCDPVACVTAQLPAEPPELAQDETPVASVILDVLSALYQALSPLETPPGDPAQAIIDRDPAGFVTVGVRAMPTVNEVHWASITLPIVAEELFIS